MAFYDAQNKYVIQSDKTVKFAIESLNLVNDAEKGCSAISLASMVTSYTVVHTVVLKAHQCLLQLVIYVFLTLNLSAWEHYLAGSDFIFTLAASSAGEESCIPKLLIHTVTEPVENNTQPIFSFLFLLCMSPGTTLLASTE